MMQSSLRKRGFNRRIILLLIYFTIILTLILLTIFTHNQNDIKLIKSTDDQPESKTAQSVIHSRSHDYFSSNLVSDINGQSKDCSPIHLAIVCGGFNSTRDFYVLLKSILFYRTNKIYLHLFVDNISKLILEELFSNWSVQDITIEFYNLTSHEHEVSWISSKHYSHRYGLLKLVILPILSKTTNLTRVILLDTDTIFLGDIKKIWKEFENMNKTVGGKKPIFGMVENQSDWYLGTGNSKSRNVWPAIGRGFNSGIVLVNLVEIERQNWSRVWRQIAELQLTSYLSTSLADQDIFNAVFKYHPSMIYELPCNFNIQLNNHSNLEKFCDERNDFRVIHWNSPYKFSVKNIVAEYYRNWYLTFRNWNGKLLEMSYCSQSKTREDQNTRNYSYIDILCREIQPRPEDKLRTYLYFYEFQWVPSEWDVSLVVHLSIDRLLVLDQLAFHWAGPISAAIYLDELETNLLLISIQNSNNLAQRRNIGYHLVFKDYGFNYPINRLRNIALNKAITPYVFLSDIDFLPSFNMYEYLKQTISDMAIGETSSDALEKKALVIPAFENVQYRFEFPTSKAELLTQLNLGSVSMFRDQIWPRGHAPTNYAKWRASTKPYRVDWKPEYEPFIVTSRNVPRYDERFVGFGWNKVENIMQLAALKYKFLVLPEAFVIHNFHSASYDIMKHRESSKYRLCIKQLRRITVLEMRGKFPDFFDSISATNQPETRTS